MEKEENFYQPPPVLNRLYHFFCSSTLYNLSVHLNDYFEVLIEKNGFSVFLNFQWFPIQAFLSIHITWKLENFFEVER